MTRFETVRHSQIMLCELSHDLPWLETSGSRILRSDTLQPTLLRGVNRSGLEYTEPTDGGFLAAAGFTEDEVRRIVSDWGANIIRSVQSGLGSPWQKGLLAGRIPGVSRPGHFLG